ncbi:MAG: hypothetical protein OXC31_05990 [Spirochaetaceae bacterium]|nr:hypothetical protein [Spirochaetaceae bacterium]
MLGIEDIDHLGNEGGGDVLSDDELLIIPYPLDGDSEAVSSLVSGLGSHPRRGDVLVQSPYGSEIYERLEDSVRTFAKEKSKCVSRICQVLGARKVKFSETAEYVEESLNTSSVKGSATVRGGPLLGGSGSASYYSEFERSLLEEIKLQFKDTFVGGEPDVPEAERLLKKNNLTNDVDLCRLIEMRGDPTNPLKRTSIRLVFVEADSYMKRTLASLDVEAMYDVASASLGVQGEQKERWKRLMRHKLNLIIEF